MQQCWTLTLVCILTVFTHHIHVAENVNDPKIDWYAVVCNEKLMTKTLYNFAKCFALTVIIMLCCNIILHDIAIQQHLVMDHARLYGDFPVSLILIGFFYGLQLT